MRRATACVLLLASALCASAQEDKPPGLDGADVPARIKAAETFLAKDADGCARAVIALGDAEKPGPTDLEFLLEYSIRENNRVLRMLAMDSARRIDPKASAAFYRKHADASDLLKTVYAVQGLSYTGDKTDVKQLLELGGNSNELIAAAAMRALPRLATTKDVDAIFDLGLGHESTRIADYSAWAVQDLLKKPKVVLKRYDKVASSKKDPRAIRAEAVQAMLLDGAVAAHEWGDTLATTRELFRAVPAEIEVKGSSKEHVEGVKAGLDWLKQNLPGMHLMLRASAKRIDVPGRDPKLEIELSEEIILVPLRNAASSPTQCAYHLAKIAGVLFQKRIGDPCVNHRGWELSVFDLYDVCVVGGLYDCGPAGLSRPRYEIGRAHV